MGANKIFFTGIMIFIPVLYAYKSAAAAHKPIGEKILAQLITVANEPALISDSADAIFIIATERSCSKCFEDVCRFNKISSRPVYVIVFMEKSLLKMLAQRSRYINLSGCIKDVFFFWSDQTADETLIKAGNEPSPQLLIVNNGVVTYYSYADFLKLIY